MTVRLLQLTIPFLPGVSKVFTAAAIDHLIKRGKLSIRTKVYKRIGCSAKDERAMSISVKHLLEHKGGYDRREASEDISVDFNKEYLSKLGYRAVQDFAIRTLA